LRDLRVKTSTGRPSYLAQLDGLRGIAILLVLWQHMPFISGSPISHAVWSAGSALRTGFIGVDLFFVLSGFLITRILLAEQETRGTIDFRLFYIKRFLRIFPIYYLSLAFVGLFLGERWDRLLFGVLYLTNYNFLVTDAPSSIGHTWSLCIEEQFYLFWPLLVWLVPPNRGRWMTGAVVPGLAVLFCLLVAAFVVWPKPEDIIYSTTPARMMSLSAGAYLAYRERDGVTFRGGPALAIFAAGLGLIVAVMAARLNGFVPNGGFYWAMLLPGFGLLSTGIVAVVAASSPWLAGVRTALSNAPLRYVGRISYGLYLYHVIILSALGAEGVDSREHGISPGQYGAAVLLIMIIPPLSYHFLEAPLLRLKSRFATPPARTETLRRKSGAVMGGGEAR
jgi:peptidoglycan/LPS O-acetylase OafA/YrhL